MASIRITSTPLGEAPEPVRRAWVGLTLPLVDGPKGSRKNHVGMGVLTGPKSFFGQVLYLLLRREQTFSGYLVDGHTAINILAVSSPTAAQWWRENAAQFIKPGRNLVFPADACQEVPEELGMKPPIVDPLGEM